MKKTLTILLVALGAASVTTMPSCKKDMAGTQQTSIADDAKIALLKQMGFQTDNIVDKGSYFIVEGDIMMNKNASIFTKAAQSPPMPSLAATQNTVKPIAQANADYLVAQSAISIYIDSSIPNDGSQNDWHASITNAISYWNSIPNNRIYFTLTTSPTADIVIQNDGGLIDSTPGLGQGALAVSSYPSTSNAPGNVIMINFDFEAGIALTESQKEFNMVHEIGHTIGLRHTNWYLNSEPTYTSFTIGSYTIYTDGANLINGTRNTGDAGSVMNGGEATNSWAGFSVFDVLAIRTIYPTDPTQEAIYRYASSTHHFYTTSWGEMGLGTGGYSYEGPCGYVYNYQATGTVPFYRYYNSSSGDHLYSQGSPAPAGYHLESIMGYVYATQVPGTTPLYRYNNPTNGHFYTISGEIGSGSGYTYEGVSCYVIQ
jgi:hypothetical protein